MSKSTFSMPLDKSNLGINSILFLALVLSKTILFGVLFPKVILGVFPETILKKLIKSLISYDLPRQILKIPLCLIDKFNAVRRSSI